MSSRDRLLTIDIGNTETALGLFEDGRLRRHWRVVTESHRTPDELAYMLRHFLLEEGVGGPLDGIIGSVVPALDPVIVRGFRRALQREPRLISDPSLYTLDGGGPLPIRLDVEQPSSVGADRMLNTLAASRMYAEDIIAVDLGTATTFDCISSDGVFLGGVIAPGPRAGIEGLARRASKLPFIDLVPPVSIIGRRTETCLRSGCFYAIVDAIDGLVRRIRSEWGRPETVVLATGGLAGLIAPYCETVDFVEPYLTLYGLEIADRILGNLEAA